MMTHSLLAYSKVLKAKVVLLEPVGPKTTVVPPSWLAADVRWDDMAMKRMLRWMVNPN